MLRQNLLRVVSSPSLPDATRLLQDPELAELGRRALDDTGRWHRRRRRLEAPFVLSFVLALSLFRDRSMADLMALLLEGPGQDESSESPPTVEAMIHARSRLGWEPVERLFERQAEQLESPPTLGKLRVWGLDGVRFTMPDTAENVRVFGRGGSPRGRAAYPQAVAVCLIDVHGRRVREVCIGPHNLSEREGVGPALQKLGPDDLVILDRGFPSAEVCEAFCEAGVNFLARIPNDWKPLYIEKTGRGEWRALIEGRVSIPEQEQVPGGRRTREVRVPVRVVEYRLGRRKRIRLVTNLAPGRARAKKLAKLYRERWECELAFDEQKNHLAVGLHARPRTVTRSKTPTGVLQEIYGLLVTYNAIRSLMLEAATRGGFDPLEVSFRRTVVLLKDWVPHLAVLGRSRRRKFRETLIARIQNLRNQRPRRPRAYKRAVKRKMSNFPLKRPGHRQQKVDRSSRLHLMHRRSTSGRAA